MDDNKRLSTASNRLSAIPRPTSRLPVPRSSAVQTTTTWTTANGLRPAPSRESLRPSSSSNDVRTTTANSRLRSSVSRDQLDAPATTASANSFRKPQRPGGPPINSQGTLQGVKSRSASRDPLSRITGDTRSQQPIAIRKRQSSVQLAGNYNRDGSPMDEENTPEMPPSRKSSMGETASSFDTLKTPSKNSRPSLSERTIETLSQLPSSPVIKRNGSSFYDNDGFYRPASRAGSGGVPARASTTTYRPPLASVPGTPSRRTSSIPKTPSAMPSPVPSKHKPRASLGPRTPSPEKNLGVSISKYGSKTVAPRPLKQRASVNGLFKKPSISSLGKPEVVSELHPRPTRKISQVSERSSTTSAEDHHPSNASTASTALTSDSVEEATSVAAQKSSAALREQIAKAKAAKRAAAKQASAAALPPTEEAPLVPTDTSFDFGLADDPFNQNQFETSNRKVMQTRINGARTTGKLNISAMGLKEIPEDVLKMYDLESISKHGGSWAESVDLTRFVAADNELEIIDDSIFPDTDPADFADEEDGNGHQFGGLESLDLHGNTMISVPLGLRRLQFLTSLNLSSNKLANNCLEVISQVTCLRDLKLGNNLLYGAMDPCFSKLENLEILDLHGNEITALPEGVENLTRLRILNLNENAIDSLPFKAFAKLPLIELLARKNRLSGTLIHPEVESLPQLQILDVSVNQLTLLASVDTPGALAMPSLHQLTLSCNRLRALPDVGSWKRLLTLNADENSIAAIPDGFTKLENLKHVDFTSNDIRVIPPEIARMDSLGMLRLSGNPLRDKKFTSLTTEELKSNLFGRLEPLADEMGGIQNFSNGIDASSRPRKASNAVRQGASPHNDDYESRSEHEDNFATPPTSAPHSPARSRSHTLSGQTWPVKTGGILDRSNTQSSSLHPVVCSKMAVEQTIRDIRLSNNTFTTLPNSLSFFADTLSSLTIAHNQLVGESYLSEELDLTALKELNLSHNHITSLGPLTAHLRAPNLQKIDISCNRLVSLPRLREFFPSLTVLLVSNNHLEDLDPESIKGLKIVDANNNDISHLNPRLGLLGGAGNLERLEVNGNRFRVPRWNVLERGTEATLRWLRGRVPVAEMGEWKSKGGNNAENEGSTNDLD
ncbi:Leucine-rich repeat-containing protein 40 [Apiospora aurea]|uniref:Leucine-rich repeat-containing protein 40 n=1 Tax=Apiospora aurea TaxID=335848 RepID=A0ABR1PXY4_9PEZI